MWLVVYTKPRWEKKVDSFLIRKGIESWCPVTKIEKIWTDRKKIIDEPIFKSYVFVRVDEVERYEVLITSGVLNFIYHLGKPAIVRDTDIDTIKRYLLEKDVTIEVISNEKFKIDSKVKINYGVFIDKKGTVLKANRKKVYVQFESLGQVMVVQFNNEHLIGI